MVRVGVLAAQGAVSEHINALDRAFFEFGIDGESVVVKSKKDIDGLDALIIPGGESTTISKFLDKTGIGKDIVDRVLNNDFPVMGTCAGCIIMAREIDDNNVKTLGIMDIGVKRNAFGRQGESFEAYINIEGFSKPYRAIFIRAPIIEKVWGDAEILARFKDKIVSVREKRLLALSFHPELTDDLRIHKMFLDFI